VAAWQRFSAETQERLCILESTEAGGLRPYPLSAALANYQAQGGKVCWQRLLPESGIDGDELVGRMAERWGFGYPRRYQFLLIASPHLRWARKRLRGKGCDLNESADHCSEAIAFGLQGCRVKLDREPVEWNPKLLSLLPYWGPPAEVTP
jgi:hypothetical protein